MNRDFIEDLKFCPLILLLSVSIGTTLHDELIEEAKKRLEPIVSDSQIDQLLELFMED